MRPDRRKAMVAIVGRDLRQVRRHGLVTLLVVSTLLFLFGLVAFSFVGSNIRECGFTSMTGSVPGGCGVPLQGQLHVTSLNGAAPLHVVVVAQVQGGTAPYEYAWSSGDGREGRGTVGDFTYDRPGTYLINLHVRDSGEGDLSLGPIPVAVSAPPLPPEHAPLVVAIGADHLEGGAPQVVSLYAAVAGGVGPYTYAWQLGDGRTDTQERPVHLYGVGQHGVRLTVTDASGHNVTTEPLHVESFGPSGGGLPFTLLDIAFGYAALVCALLLPTIFALTFRHELARGTVRVLTTYPVGVLEVTVAKLCSTGALGLLLGLPIVVLPMLLAGLPTSTVLGIFLVAYLLTMVTIAVGAMLSCLLARARGRMVLRPTSIPFALTIPFFVLTRLSGWLLQGLVLLVHLPQGTADGLAAVLLPLVTISPYHQGGLLLSMVQHGGNVPDVLVWPLPVLVLLAGGVVTKALYPDLYERE